MVSSNLYRNDLYQVYLCISSTFSSLVNYVRVTYTPKLQCSASSFGYFTLSPHYRQTLKHPYSQVTFSTSCQSTPKYNCLIGYHQVTHVIALVNNKFDKSEFVIWFVKLPMNAEKEKQTIQSFIEIFSLTLILLKPKVISLPSV